jgi:hypothetical protein
MTKIQKDGDYKGGFEIEFLPSLHEVSNGEDLKTLLSSLEQGLKAHDLPPVYVLLLVNNLVERGEIYEWLTDETKAIGERVFAQLKLEGFQLEMPPIFSGGSEPIAAA